MIRLDIKKSMKSVEIEGEVPMEGRVLIFAGTTEGRKLSEYLKGHAVRVHICVATEYGRSLLPEGGTVTVSHNRMDVVQMESLIQEFCPDHVVDATHPYAYEATRNIQEACRVCKSRYYRLIRESCRADGYIYAADIEEAVAFLSGTKGNILAVTGSKELTAYTKLKDYKERLYTRVLSVAGVVEKCEQLGIRGRHLICMQGPFSVEMNTAVLKEYEIDWFVTKESGKAGGFPEKYEAARRAGAKLVVIGRPEKEEGYTLEEMYAFLREEIGLTAKPHWVQRKIALIGIGTGDQDYFTMKAMQICKEAEIIIGARRVVMAAAFDGQDTFFEYRAANIVDHIKKHPEYKRIAVVFSGDTGFYSGAKRLLSAFQADEELRSGLDIEIVPGISSAAYFCAKLHITWEDAQLVSVHGKKGYVISAVRDHKKTIVLIGDAKGIRKLGTDLAEYGYGDLTVCVGESLSYDDEKITWLEAGKLCDYNGTDLAVLYIYNPEGGRCGISGLPDKAFVRGKVPMTKEEVRSVSLLKLCLKRDSIVYDIGAGTGSVAVEAAVYAAKGEVFAIETKEEAVALILKNKRMFKTDNLVIIQGEAPEALEGLPMPDSVFIGGSGGRLREILYKLKEVLWKAADSCAKIKVVINTVTLETLSEATQCLNEMKQDVRVRIEEEETVQLSSARAKNIGSHHLMMGQNPIFIISFQMVCKK